MAALPTTSISGHVPGSDPRPFTVALVNNMPDSAFVDTEAQFRRATAAAYPAPHAFELYTITDIPRSPEISSVINSRYHGLEELWTRAPDALIVSGTEPTRVHMDDEPYWPAVAQLLEWAAEVVPTVLLSCLAAHAGLLLFDGIERGARARKRSGVLRGVVIDPRDPLANGLPAEVPVPHSRRNEVPEHVLDAAGYRIIIGGDAQAPADWSVAARERGEALFVLCQGHPEYGRLSLLREYRRDVRRFLFEPDAFTYPRLPEGYLAPAAARRLEHFGARAVRAGADPDALWREFPYREVADGVQNTWAAASATLYANWITSTRAASRAVA